MQRAEYVRDRLNETAGKSVKRFVPIGVGPRQLIVGTGRDDSSDALDRRVEFKTIPCAGLTVTSGKASPDKPVSKAASKRPDGGEPEKASEPAPKPKAAAKRSPKRYVDEDGNVRSQQVPGEVRRQLRSYGIDID